MFLIANDNNSVDLAGGEKDNACRQAGNRMKFLNKVIGTIDNTILIR